MKEKLTATASTIAMIALCFVVRVHAEDINASHEAHHPKMSAQQAVKASETPKESQGGMMGKMDMGQMMGMMHECMGKHKDGKMCETECMTKCQENMSKGECSKMMGQMKMEEHKKSK